ncbi:MAG: hypothetical protein GX028_03820, partial [Clostridiaceae bacterium]|nr:hypothetical protein [Clostridiaceae bacterium]
NENDTWVHFQCGPLGAGHGHADKQHVSLLSRGENVLTDAGRYSYVFGPDRVQFKELRAHNTIMADGHDLYVCKDSWEVSRLTRAVNLRFYSDNKYAYTEGGHLGYLGLPDGIFINRRVIFLKPDIIILADEFYSSGSHDYNQFFHFSNEGKLNQNSLSSWTYSGESVSAQIQFISQNIESSAFDSRISYHYNSFEPSNAVETKFSIQGCGCAYTVIGLSDANAKFDLDVNKLEVKSNFKDITFTDKQIEALEVKLGSQHYVVVVAHEEYASPTDTFLAGNCYGFGNAVVFDRSENEFETGTVLIW